MPKFFYKAIRSDGTPTTGEVESPTVSSATQELEAQGLRIVSVRPLEKKQQSKLRPEDFRILTEQLSDLTEAKLPLASGLTALAEELPPNRLRRALVKMVRQLESGENLASVLASHGAPADLQALIHSGVRTGDIGHVLAQYVGHLRGLSNLKLRALLAFGSPFASLLMAAIVGLFCLVWVVPDFKNIFLDFGIALPAITVSLLFVSDLVVIYGIWVLLGLLLIAGILIFAFRTSSHLNIMSKLFRALPMVGSLIHWTAMSRFCHLLASLIENRLPLPEAIILAGEGTSDAGIRTACHEFAEHVATGEPLSPANRALSGFPASFIQTLIEQKQATALPEALHAIADMYEGRTRLQSNFFTAICGPLVVIFTGIVIGYVVIALFMPLVKLLNDLS